MLVPLLLGGAGLIIAGVGTGFYIDGDSKYSSLKTQCSTPPGCSTPAYNAAGSMIQRDDGLGIGGWILGGGLIAYGALWYGLSAPKDAAGARLVVDPFTRSAGVVGRF